MELDVDHISTIDKQTMLNDCIRVLHQQVLNGAANIQVASAKELISLLGGKEKLEGEKVQEDRPLFRDLFLWRKVKGA